MNYRKKIKTVYFPQTQGVCMTLYESHMNYRDEETAKARGKRNKINREIHASRANYWENNCREMTIEQAEQEVRKC